MSTDLILILAGLLGAGATLTGVYLKGRASGKAKGESLLQSAEIAAQKTINEESVKVAKGTKQIKEKYEKARAIVTRHATSSRVSKKD